jgi:hypothetical protein
MNASREKEKETTMAEFYDVKLKKKVDRPVIAK